MPKGKPGDVGLRHHSKWLGRKFPTTRSAKAKPGGACKRILLALNMPPGGFTGGFLFDAAPGLPKFKVQMGRSLCMHSDSSSHLVSRWRVAPTLPSARIHTFPCFDGEIALFGF